jgi:hypothetical protein
MKEPLTCRALSRANPAMLRLYGAARVVMSWRRNRAAIELKVDRTKKALATCVSAPAASISRHSQPGAMSKPFAGGAYPPNTLLIVDHLVQERVLIEVSAVAAL